MVRYIEVESESLGIEWCNNNGYQLLDIGYDEYQRVILCYEDNTYEIMSPEEEEYYLKKLEDEREDWVIESEDYINSTMYKGKQKNSYTFKLTEAKRFKRAEAYKVATMMTKRSKVGRVWVPRKIK